MICVSVHPEAVPETYLCDICNPRTLDVKAAIVHQLSNQLQEGRAEYPRELTKGKNKRKLKTNSRTQVRSLKDNQIQNSYRQKPRGLDHELPIDTSTSFDTQLFLNMNSRGPFESLLPFMNFVSKEDQNNEGVHSNVFEDEYRIYSKNWAKINSIRILSEETAELKERLYNSWVEKFSQRLPMELGESGNWSFDVTKPIFVESSQIPERIFNCTVEPIKSSNDSQGPRQLGLFAISDIPAGFIAAVIKGTLVSGSELISTISDRGMLPEGGDFIPTAPFVFPHLIPGKEWLAIDSREYGDRSGRFVRFSCKESDKCNAVLMTTIIDGGDSKGPNILLAIFSVTGIKPSEEIVIFPHPQGWLGYPCVCDDPEYCGLERYIRSIKMTPRVGENSEFGERLCFKIEENDTKQHIYDTENNPNSGDTLKNGIFGLNENNFDCEEQDSVSAGSTSTPPPVYSLFIENLPPDPPASECTEEDERNPQNFQEVSGIPNKSVRYEGDMKGSEEGSPAGRDFSNNPKSREEKQVLERIRVHNIVEQQKKKKARKALIKQLKDTNFAGTSEGTGSDNNEVKADPKSEYENGGPDSWSRKIDSQEGEDKAKFSQSGDLDDKEEVLEGMEHKEIKATFGSSKENGEGRNDYISDYQERIETAEDTKEEPVQDTEVEFGPYDEARDTSIYNQEYVIEDNKEYDTRDSNSDNHNFTKEDPLITKNAYDKLLKSVDESSGDVKNLESKLLNEPDFFSFQNSQGKIRNSKRKRKTQEKQDASEGSQVTNVENKKDELLYGTPSELGKVDSSHSTEISQHPLEAPSRIPGPDRVFYKGGRKAWIIETFRRDVLLKEDRLNERNEKPSATERYLNLSQNNRSAKLSLNSENVSYPSETQSFTSHFSASDGLQKSDLFGDVNLKQDQVAIQGAASMNYRSDVENNVDFEYSNVNDEDSAQNTPNTGPSTDQFKVSGEKEDDKRDHSPSTKTSLASGPTTEFGAKYEGESVRRVSLKDLKSKRGSVNKSSAEDSNERTNPSNSHYGSDAEYPIKNNIKNIRHWVTEDPIEYSIPGNELSAKNLYERGTSKKDAYKLKFTDEKSYENNPYDEKFYDTKTSEDESYGNHSNGESYRDKTDASPVGNPLSKREALFNMLSFHKISNKPRLNEHPSTDDSKGFHFSKNPEHDSGSLKKFPFDKVRSQSESHKRQSSQQESYSRREYSEKQSQKKLSPLEQDHRTSFKTFLPNDTEPGELAPSLSKKLDRSKKSSRLRKRTRNKSRAHDNGSEISNFESPSPIKKSSSFLSQEDELEPGELSFRTQTKTKGLKNHPDHSLTSKPRFQSRTSSGIRDPYNRKLDSPIGEVFNNDNFRLGSHEETDMYSRAPSYSDPQDIYGSKRRGSKYDFDANLSRYSQIEYPKNKNSEVDSNRISARSFGKSERKPSSEILPHQKDQWSQKNGGGHDFTSNSPNGLKSGMGSPPSEFQSSQYYHKHIENIPKGSYDKDQSHHFEGADKLSFKEPRDSRKLSKSSRRSGERSHCSGGSSRWIDQRYEYRNRDRYDHDDRDRDDLIHEYRSRDRCGADDDREREKLRRYGDEDKDRRDAFRYSEKSRAREEDPRDFHGSRMRDCDNLRDFH